MSLEFFLLAMILPFMIYEGIMVFFKYVNSLRLLAYRILHRFCLLVLVQLSILVYEEFISESKLNVPIWILMFVFYGPYFYLLFSFLINKKHLQVFRIYLVDFYLAVFVFCFGVLLSLLRTEYLFVKDLQFLTVAIILMFYWFRIRGFFKKSKEYKISYKSRSLQNYHLRSIDILFVFSLLVCYYGFAMRYSLVDVRIISVFVLILFYIHLSFVRNIMSQISGVKKLKINHDLTDQLPVLDDYLKDVIHSVDDIEGVKGDLEILDLVNDNLGSGSLEAKEIDITQRKNRLNAITLERCNSKVSKVIIEGKAYLNPDFKMSDLAIQTKISRYYLAQYFNDVHNVNFREYLNKLRIEFILVTIDNCDDKRKLSVNDLFIDSAFNSKTSFFKNFKSVTGCTPADYLKKVV